MDQTLEENIEKNGIELAGDMPGEMSQRRETKGEPEISPELKKNIVKNGVGKGLDALYEFCFSKARENYQKGDKEKAKSWANLLKNEEAYQEIRQLAELPKLVVEGYLTLLELESGKNGYLETKSRQILKQAKGFYQKIEKEEKEGKIEAWEGENQEKEKNKKELNEVIELIEKFYMKKEEMKDTKPKEKEKQPLVYGRKPSEAEKLRIRAEDIFGKIKRGEKDWGELEGKLREILGEAESYILRNRLREEEAGILKGIINTFRKYRKEYGK